MTLLEEMVWPILASPLITPIIRITSRLTLVHTERGQPLSITDAHLAVAL
jgi:hypothetical protein